MRKIYLLLLLLISILSTTAQTSKYSNFDVTAQTPTTAQFSRYDEMPVSEYTGIPSISVPLYEINVDEVKIPLRLTYHSGGIKVNQEASWVGLGWDMSVGAIVQTINGEDDLFPYRGGTYKFRPDYFPSYYYNVEFFPWKDDNYEQYDSPRIDTLQRYPIEIRYGYRVATNFYVPEKGKYVRKEALFNTSLKYVDGEPDIFIANFLGEKLHFIMEFKDDSGRDVYYDRPTKAIVLNKKGYKIDIQYSGDFLKNSTWIITNPQGVKYYFEKRIETMSSYSGAGRYPSYGSTDYSRARNTWMLTKIVTQNQRNITFGYETTVSATRDITYSQVGEEGIIPQSEYIVRAQDHKSNFWKPNQFPVKLLQSISKTQEPYCYLSSIQFPGGNAQLKLSDRQDVSDAKKLDSLIVASSTGQVVKKIALNYDYYKETGSKYRLKLIDVVVEGTDKYAFKYNNTLLPPKNSYAQDYWGYYNGCMTNTSFLPNPARLLYHNTKHIDNGNNNSANLEYTKAGILESITYPTGGSVSFNYELNEFEKIDNYWIPDYDNNTNILSKGYGLRVKDIVYKTADNEEVKKIAYEYKKGKAITPQKPVRVVNYETFDPVWAQQVNSLKIFMEYIAILSTAGSSQSNPFSSNTGVGYDTVITVQKGKNMDLNGKVVSVFYNSYDISHNTQDPGGHGYFVTYLPSIKNPNFPENGSIKQKLFYNDKGSLIKQSNYDYKTVFSNIDYGVKISGFSPIIRSTINGKQDVITVTINQWPPRLLFAYYPIFDFETLMTKEENTDYLNNNIKVTKNYLYDDYNRISNITTHTSKGDSVREELLYPSGVSASLLLPKNRYGEIVGVNKYLNNNPIYYLKKNYKSDAGLVLVDRVDEGLTQQSAQSNYFQYTGYGKIKEKKGTDEKYTTYFWDQDFLYPIAIIKNSSYQKTIEALAGLNPDGTLAGSPDFSKIEDLRIKLPQAEVSTYTYYPLIGMKTATDPKGMVTKYDYDWAGRLKTIYLEEDSKDKIIKRYQYDLPSYVHLRDADYVEPKPEPEPTPEPEPQPDLTPDPYIKGKTGSVLINIGAKGDGSYGLTGWNYDTQSVQYPNVITKTYKTIEAGEYQWTTENLRLKYGTYASLNMTWVNLTQADVDKYANDYLGGKKIPLEEFEQVFGTWATLYDFAMMYRNIYWGIPKDGDYDHTWALPSKDDIWQLYGLAPRTSGNVYEDIKDFLFASPCDNKYNWTQNMFNRRNISGLTLTPLGMRESYQGGAIYGFGQVASLQTSDWAKIETLSDMSLSGASGIISNPYSYHFTQARHRRPLTDQELGYKLYKDVTNDQILMLPYNQASTLPELAKGLERGIALRYTNREHMKVLKKWSEIQAEAAEIKSKLAPTNYPAPPALLPCQKDPEPEITADPYTKGKESSVLINIGAKGDGSYGMTGWNYDTKSVQYPNVITKTYKTIEASEYQWTTENLRLKYGTYASINMNWVNFTQADVDKYSADYLGGRSIPLDEFEQVYGTWATLYDVAMMYRNIYWGVPKGTDFDHTWGIPNKEDIWQLYGQAPRISNNLYNDIKDFLFASSSDFNFGWTQGLFKNKNTSGLALTPLGMRESYQGGAIYGFSQVTSLQTNTWAAVETLADRDLSGKSGLISNPYTYHFTQARHRRPLTDQELGYKMYIDVANDQVLMLPYNQTSTLPELPKGLERGVALRYANRSHLKVVKKWSEIQAEALEIKNTISK